MATAAANAEYRVGRKVVKIWFFLKCVQTLSQGKEGLFISCHGLPYIISNLPMWTITMSKGLRIAPCIAEKTWC